MTNRKLAGVTMPVLAQFCKLIPSHSRAAMQLPHASWVMGIIPPAME